MPRYFTHYWSNQTWMREAEYVAENNLIDHIAGNLFSERNIAVGDTVYVVTVIKGKLYLCGKLIVGKICNADEAAAHFNCRVDDLWGASEHIIASAATSQNFDFRVPLEVTLKLKFKSGKSLKYLTFSSPNYLDQQTLRGVRELDLNSALELDKFLPPLMDLSGKSLSTHQSSPLEEEIFPDEVFGAQTYYEGAIKQVVVNKYERSTQARKDCIARHGVNCSVCGFNFKKFYGEIGDGYIHVHHLTPLAEIGEGYKLNAFQDLRPVCPNCHAMLHRSKTVYTIEELQKLLKRRND